MIKNSKLYLLDEIKSPTRKLANSIAFDEGWESRLLDYTACYSVCTP
ncbi:hypothetical protein NVP1170O_122 [Vibrio phage 1.170.O._10N.261.52.C3]|nr:hypothetical protein NVP1170O_122 [Vibrio phage 1.170.O._10N.261.52.C3]